jgi:HAD superfamily hydrolase (TIGR01509 family)
MDIRIKKFGLKKYFKDFITSGYVGYAKRTAKRIYKILIKRAGLKAKEILFIDDKKRNIITAKQIGFNTILFKNKQRLEKELKEYGFKL